MLLRKSEELTELKVEYDRLIRQVGLFDKKEALIHGARMDELAGRIQILREEVGRLLECCKH